MVGLSPFSGGVPFLGGGLSCVDQYLSYWRGSHTLHTLIPRRAQHLSNTHPCGMDT